MRKLARMVTGLMTVSTGVWGNPQNPTVVSGSASFSSPDPQTLNVTAGNFAIIEWDGFSIDTGETTTFTLPSPAASVLNRVVTLDPSVLSGFLQSNGQVYLINQNGILVSDNGVINTAAFLASTLDVPNSEFSMGGALHFTDTTQETLTVNGQVTAWNGDVVLLGYNVVSNGVITSSEGVVGIGAGTQITLSSSSNQIITIVPSMSGSPSGIGIYHEGVIKAIQAELKSDGSLYSYAIQCDGLVSANSTAMINGRVYLVPTGGVNLVTGTIRATGFDAPGGEIQVLGDTVILFDNCRINAYGGTAGGTVLVGGSFQGSDPTILNSQFTYVDTSVAINADCSGTTGNGGEIVIWSDGDTYFYGNASAQAAPFGGNGGTIEVSGLMFLDFQGTTNVFAANGMQGTVLMDPTDIVFDTVGQTTSLYDVGIGSDLGRARTSTINIADLSAQLENGNVVVMSEKRILLPLSEIKLEGKHTLTLEAESVIVDTGMENPGRDDVLMPLILMKGMEKCAN